MIKALINIFLIMKKQILNIGKALNKAEQRTIKGGALTCGVEGGTCPPSGPYGNYFCCEEQALCRYESYQHCD
jgi:hypothetical protein